MTRLIIGAAIGVALGVVVGAALGIHAQQPDVEVDSEAVACNPDVGCTSNAALLDQVVAVAQEAGVDATDLLGAANTTGLDPRAYLIAVGELAPPVSAPISPPIHPNSGWPIGGTLGQRIYCVEGIESTHGLRMYNPTPWRGEHAQGWLGFLPSTARRWGAVIGNRASEWSAAAAMIRAGAGSQFYGISVGLC